MRPLFVRVTRAALLAVGAALAMAALGADDSSAQRLPPGLRARLTTVEQLTRAHATSRQPTSAARVLAAVVAGLPPRSVESAHVALPPPGWGASNFPGMVGHGWLYLRMRPATNDTYHERIADWEAEIVAGGFRQAAHDLGLDGIRGVSMTAHLPNGRTTQGATRVITTPFPLPVQTERKMRQKIVANVVHDGRFQDAHLDFVHGYASVPIVTVRFEPAKAFANPMDAVRPVFGDPLSYEGLLLKVVDSSGRLVQLAGYANGTGARFSLSPR